MAGLAGSGVAHFMQLRGYRVMELRGVLWHQTHLGMFMSLPYRLCIDLDPNEVASELPSMNSIGVRYPSQLWNGLPSGIYINRRREYGLNCLHRTFRARVRQGESANEVRRVSESELMDQALEINRETMQRQHRYDPEFGDPDRWRTFVRALGECPCIVAVGAFVDRRLAAYAITTYEDGWLEVLYRMNSVRFDQFNSSHCLDFHIAQQIRNDPALQAISLGWAPLVPAPGLHEYKLKLGYEFEHCFSVIRFHSGLQDLLNSDPVFAAARLAARLRPKSYFLRMGTAVLDGARRSGAVCAGQPSSPFKTNTY